MTSHLADIWFFILLFILWVYVVLDGFDLGVGILSLFSRKEAHRATFIRSIVSVWHANQTWLVVLGGVLFGAFPLVYGLALSALYIPIGAMLLGFILRGVSIEFSDAADRKVVWQKLFGLGSLLATLAHGFVLGTLLLGLKMEGDRFIGSVWDWLNPFASLAALDFVVGYSVLGATYLIIKSDGDIKLKAYRMAYISLVFLILATSALVLWAAILHPVLMRRWFSWPGFFVTTFPLLLVVFAIIGLFHSLIVKRRYTPFVLSAVVFGLLILSFAAMLYPTVIPPSITLARAAALPLTLKAMLVGIGLLLPIMIIYNVYHYWVFRDKVNADQRTAS
jgi:cytochrome d ubiquinol oxidase subunit II